MCAFCAAIPVAGALGAKAQSRQHQEIERAKVEGRPVKKQLPIGRMTAVVVCGLAVGSVLYHTHIGGPII